MAGVSRALHEEIAYECFAHEILVEPWGRLVKDRADLHDPELSSKFWQWCEEQVKGY